MKNLFKKDNGVLNIDVKSLEEAVGETDIFNIDDLFKLLIILSIILTPILIILCSNKLYQNKIFMLIIAIINSIVLVKYIAILLSQSKVNFGTVNAYVLIINFVGLYISLKLLNNKLKTK